MPISKRSQNPITPKRIFSYLLMAFGLLMIFTSIYAASFEPKNQDAPAGLIVGVPFLIWGWVIYRREHKPSEIVVRTINFTSNLGSLTIRIGFDVQLPKKLVDQKKPVDDNEKHNVENAPPIVQRLQADVGAILMKFIESGPPREVFNGTLMENLVEPAMLAIQDSYKIPYLKYDCLTVSVTGPPRPTPDSSDDFSPIPDSVRDKHVYIPGKTRHGKSTVLLHLILADIKSQKGVCVIDPKGDLVTELLHHIPAARIEDCIYFDPFDPIPIDILDAANQREEQTLVGELKYAITRGVPTDSMPLMNSILNDVIYTILEANRNGLTPKATFLDIHDFLMYENRRKEILQFAESRRRRWEENMPAPKERQPTLTRMNDHINSAYLRKVFGCPDPPLNISRAMDEKKILLVNLGGIDEPTKVFGTMLIAKLRQAAFRRHAQTANRVPFYLFVDEFEYFQTSDFNEILSFAGGYGLSLTIANQFFGQLDGTIRQSILGNIGSFIIYSLSKQDATQFSHILPKKPHWAELNEKYMKDLMDFSTYNTTIETLPPFKALLKVSGREPKWIVCPPPPDRPYVSHAELIIERTKRIYTCPPCKTPEEPHTEGNGTRGDTTGRSNTPQPPGVPVSHAQPTGKSRKHVPTDSSEKLEPPHTRRKVP